MRAIFMGKSKRSAVGALEHLLERGWEVPAVVAPAPDPSAAPEQRLDLAAERHGLALVTDDDLYASIGELGEVDLVLSFLFWKRIRRPLIELPRLGCINFHPAPLPDMRGIGGYNVAILEGWDQWGVSAHQVDEEFDTGDLVQVDRFPIDPDRETAFSLALQSQERLLATFRSVVDRALAGEELPRTPQGDGRYVTRAEFEELRRVRPDDTPERLARRIRAFWHPPYDGATLEVAGQVVTVMDAGLLQETAAAYRNAGLFP
ncbi:MAG: formyl transferase [Thermoleophilaceae bacterium]|nr:formyl transferase [Thermoleophilaceae bacterium]